jgi:hypothetical protein
MPVGFLARFSFSVEGESLDGIASWPDLTNALEQGRSLVRRSLIIAGSILWLATAALGQTADDTQNAPPPMAGTSADAGAPDEGTAAATAAPDAVASDTQANAPADEAAPAADTPPTENAATSPPADTANAAASTGDEPKDGATGAAPAPSAIAPTSSPLQAPPVTARQKPATEITAACAQEMKEQTCMKKQAWCRPGLTMGPAGCPVKTGFDQAEYTQCLKAAGCL